MKIVEFIGDVKEAIEDIIEIVALTSRAVHKTKIMAKDSSLRRRVLFKGEEFYKCEKGYGLREHDLLVTLACNSIKDIWLCNMVDIIRSAVFVIIISAVAKKWFGDRIIFYFALIVAFYMASMVYALMQYQFKVDEMKSVIETFLRDKELPVDCYKPLKEYESKICSSMKVQNILMIVAHVVSVCVGFLLFKAYGCRFFIVTATVAAIGVIIVTFGMISQADKYTERQYHLLFDFKMPTERYDQKGFLIKVGKKERKLSFKKYDITVIGSYLVIIKELMDIEFIELSEISGIKWYSTK